MNLSDQIKPSSNVIAKEVGGETVLMDLASGTYFGLDPVGTRIWQLLEEDTRPLAEISASVASEYEAPAETVEQDLLKLAAKLVEHGLAEKVES